MWLRCAALQYISDYKWDVSKLEPVVAAPHSPDNRKLARECSDVRIDRAYIGSCTGAWRGAWCCAGAGARSSKGSALGGPGVWGFVHRTVVRAA